MTQDEHLLERLAESIQALHVQPAKAAAHGDLVFGNVFYDKFDELGHFGIGSAAADLIPGDNDIAEDGDGG